MSERVLTEQELRERFERILKDHEEAVRADIVNHINGDKSRDPYITCADSRMQLENLFQSQKLAAVEAAQEDWHGNTGL